MVRRVFRCARGGRDMRLEAHQRLPPIIRKLVWRHEFKPGSELLVYEDNEERTYEAVLKREGLATRSGRFPKGLPLNVKAVLAYVL